LVGEKVDLFAPALTRNVISTHPAGRAFWLRRERVGRMQRLPDLGQAGSNRQHPRAGRLNPAASFDRVTAARREIADNGHLRLLGEKLFCRHQAGALRCATWL